MQHRLSGSEHRRTLQLDHSHSRAQPIRHHGQDLVHRPGGVLAEGGEHDPDAGVVTLARKERAKVGQAVDDRRSAAAAWSKQFTHAPRATRVVPPQVGQAFGVLLTLAIESEIPGRELIIEP